MASSLVNSQAVVVESAGVELPGDLAMPQRPVGLVLFAHGGGSSRASPRNRAVAGVLNEGDLATLLMDLLTADEQETDELTGRLRFDIDLLSRRLVGAIDWLAKREQLASLPLGLFGASTGAAGALVAAAQRPAVAAVVSRGGRPDLAVEYLSQVACPVLLIVGGDDVPVLNLNQEAMELLHSPKELKVVAGATHLFPEPGKLREVAELARDFFVRRLSARRAAG
jgi:pimeloyl-ACP methyl ester carboxylesterase